MTERPSLLRNAKISSYMQQPNLFTSPGSNKTPQANLKSQVI